MVGWLFGFYGISTYVDYSVPNPFYANNQFYFKPFSLAWVHSLSKTLSKTFLFQTIQFIRTILIQLIQFSISRDFIYTVKCQNSSIYKTIQFSVSRVSMTKTVPFQTIQFSINTLWARVDLGVMAIKGYTTFPKAPALLEPDHQIDKCHIRTLISGGGDLTLLQNCSRCILQP